jgi:hypothetical protein
MLMRLRDHREAHRAWSWPVLKALRDLCEALHEGVAAQRRYEVLTSKRVPHDRALREALGIDQSACEIPRRRSAAIGPESEPPRPPWTSLGSLSYVK